MPIYVYGCKCGNRQETIQAIGDDSPACSKCGSGMAKMPTAPALVLLGKASPSFRKQHLGTAPYTSRAIPSEVKGGIGSPMPIAKEQGEKWLESIE